MRFAALDVWAVPARMTRPDCKRCGAPMVGGAGWLVIAEGMAVLSNTPYACMAPLCRATR